MNTKYIIFSFLFVLIAGGLLLIPERYNYKQTPPEMMLKELTQPTRYLSTDKVAARIIDEDPSIVLVDVRDPLQFEAFSLEGAINIPLPEILEDEYRNIIDSKERDIIFYSNGDIDAEKAWMICRREGFKNLYIMKGGLNEWAATIMKPIMPPTSASSDEFDLYQFRRAACQYFVEDSLIMEAALSVPPPPPVRVPEPVILHEKEAEEEIDGGC